MTTTTTPSTNGVHDHNGHAPGPLPPASDGGAQPKPVADGRTATGTFAPGNKLGKGNPFTRKLGAKRAAFVNAVTDEEVAELARELYELALDGDVQAAALFLSYAVGKPTNAVDPDALDLDEWKRLEASPTFVKLIRVLADVVDVEEALETVAEKPGIGEKLAKKLREVAQGQSFTLPNLQLIFREREARVGK